VLVFGNRSEDGGDEFRIGRQRDVFFRAGVNGGNGGLGVVIDAASDDRNVNTLFLEHADQIPDRLTDIDHQKIGAAPGAQHAHGLIDVFGVRDLGAAIHGDLGRLRELARQGSDDHEPHGPYSLNSNGAQRSLLMISVMVTPSLSSTSTTSPRATRRSLT
jgi:hypothetical protein